MTGTYLIPVPDPAGAASYQVVYDGQAFMGSDLVTATVDEETLDLVLTKVGDSSNLLEEADYVEIARRSYPDGDGLIHYLAALPTQLYALALRSDDWDADDPVLVWEWWVVDSDGTDSLVATDAEWASDVLSSDLRRLAGGFFDQRLEPTARVYAWPGEGDAAAYSIPDAAALYALAYDDLDVGESGAVNIEASTWAAFLIGDTSEAATQPDPPDSFEATTTIQGWHIPTDADDEVYFSVWKDRGEFGTDVTMSNWEGAVVSWSLTGYGGTIPDVYLAISGLSSNVVQIEADGTTISADDLGSPTISNIETAYQVSPGDPEAIRAGALFITYNPDLFPDVGDDFFAKMTVQATRTDTITPAAPYRYTQGQYRYLNATTDDTSSYTTVPDHRPGTEYMHADFFDATSGRWTLVVGLIQDGDGYGGDNLGSLAVYFDPFGVVTLVAPPLRQYPRTDGLASSSSRRLYPPPPSIQASNRRAGGYL